MGGKDRGGGEWMASFLPPFRKSLDGLFLCQSRHAVWIGQGKLHPRRWGHEEVEREPNFFSFFLKSFVFFQDF